MSSAKREFRLIKLCQKLCLDITEMQGTADKKYRFTICQDIRKKSEDVIHLVRTANDLPSGNAERMRIQEKADRLLEEIKDLLWIAGKLLNTGAKREAQIELSIENLQIPLHNWMERDQKIALSAAEKALNQQGWALYRAKRTYELVKEWQAGHQDKKTASALEQSKSRYRIAHKDYRAAVDAYDLAMKKLLHTQERYHKDDSVLHEVLTEMKKSGIDVPETPAKENIPVSDAVVKEKKKTVATANEKIIEDGKEYLAKSTIEKLRAQNF